jgi:MFS family permease
VVAAILAAAYVIISPSSVDLAAHLFRAEMFRQQGFAVWNNYWYSGNAVLGYSVLFPAVSATLTPQLAAAIATTGTATVFTVLARRHFGERGWVGAMLFGAATAADLYSGRLAFAFGALPALGAILALDSEQPALAYALAVLSALCSPVAALFAALVAAGHALGGAIATRRAAATDQTARDTPRRPALQALRAASPGLAVIVASLLPVLIIAWMFPQGGTEPFAFTTMLPLLVASAVALVLLPRDAVRLRAGVLVYALATLAIYLIPTPIGSNIARMGTFAALPLTALVWWGRRPLALALVFLPLLYLGWSPAFRDGIAGDIDDTTSTAFYAPLLGFLHREASAPGAVPFRTEIPFTQFHWETYAVASRFSLARGWERQLDIHDNHIFYGGRLTPATYDRWLHDNAVRFVAISDADPDYSARAEVKLINRGLPYLRLVFRSRHWRVYQVHGATPIVQGSATLQTLGPGSLTLRATRPGTVLVHLHFTPYWELARGSGCVGPDGNATRLTLRRSGEVQLVTHFSLDRIGAHSPRCN